MMRYLHTEGEEHPPPYPLLWRPFWCRFFFSLLQIGTRIGTVSHHLEEPNLLVVPICRIGTQIGTEIGTTIWGKIQCFRRKCRFADFISRACARARGIGNRHRNRHLAVGIGLQFVKKFVVKSYTPLLVHAGLIAAPA